MVVAAGGVVAVGVVVARDLGSVRRQNLLDGRVLDLRVSLATLSVVQFQLEEPTRTVLFNVPGGNSRSRSWCPGAPRPNVRFGSNADIRASITDVRFTPKSGHHVARPNPDL